MKPNREQLFSNFMGKPNAVTIKGTDGVDYDFDFQQFDMMDLVDFLKISDKWLKFIKGIEDKKAKGEEMEFNDFNPEMLKEAIPWVEKMVAISYKEWSPEEVKIFTNANFMFLFNVMFATNLSSLFNAGTKNADIDKFIEAERKKMEAKKVG